jgi:hypothetical protein
MSTPLAVAYWIAVLALDLAIGQVVEVGDAVL